MSRNTLILMANTKATKKEAQTPKTKGAKTAAKAKQRALAAMVQPKAGIWKQSALGVENGTTLGIVRVIGIRETRNEDNDAGYNLYLMDANRIGVGAKKHVQVYFNINTLKNMLYATPEFVARKTEWVDIQNGSTELWSLIDEDVHINQYETFDYESNTKVPEEDRVLLRVDDKPIYMYGVYIYNQEFLVDDPALGKVNKERVTPRHIVDDNGNPINDKLYYVFNRVVGLGRDVEKQLFALNV